MFLHPPLQERRRPPRPGPPYTAGNQPPEAPPPLSARTARARPPAVAPAGGGPMPTQTGAGGGTRPPRGSRSTQPSRPWGQREGEREDREGEGVRKESALVFLGLRGRRAGREKRQLQAAAEPRACSWSRQRQLPPAPEASRCEDCAVEELPNPAPRRLLQPPKAPATGAPWSAAAQTPPKMRGDGAGTAPNWEAAP